MSDLQCPKTAFMKSGRETARRATNNGDDTVVTIWNRKESLDVNPLAANQDMTSNLTAVRRPSQQGMSAYPKPAETYSVEETVKTEPATTIKEEETDEEEKKEEEEEKREEKEERVYMALNMIEATERKTRHGSKRLWVLIQLERIAFLCIIGIVIATLTTHKLRHNKIWDLQIWKWSVLALAIFSGRLIADCSIYIVKNLLFGKKEKFLYYINQLKRNLRVLIWFCLILVAWGVLIEDGVRRSRSTSRILNHVTRFLGCCLVGTFLWLAKDLLVEMLGSSSHVTRFYDRIRKSVFDKYLLMKLSEGPKRKMEETVDDDKSSFRIEVQDMMDAIQGVSLGAGIYDAEGAKKVAKRIFKEVAKSDTDYIHGTELLRFMAKKDVDKAIPLFQGATDSRKIKDSSFRKWLVEAYKDRKALENSLKNTKTAIDELDGILTGITAIAFMILSLLLMGLVTTKVILLISSQLVLVAFMFGNTCKTVFESIIFVFVMHPFDLDDRCSIDGVQMVVEEMQLLTTIFLRYDGEMIIYPNSVLATKPISNFYRSPPMGDSLLFTVDFSTSKDTIEELQERIKAYLESMPHRWSKEHSVVVRDIVNVNQMNIAVYVTHTINFQNFGRKNSRRSDLLLELKKIFEDLDIQYRLLPQEVHLKSIN